MAPSMITELSSNDKFTGLNYDSWLMKNQYLLNEKDVLEYIIMDQPDSTSPTYDSWAKKDRNARYTMLYCMHDDLIGHYDAYVMAKAMWEALKVAHGQTSATRLRTLHMNWLQYKIDSSRPVLEHLRIMSSMLRDLKAGGIEISEFEQVNKVIRSLPEETEDRRWTAFKTMMSHDLSLKTFSDISKHLELEDERLRASGQTAKVLVAHGKHPRKKFSCLSLYDHTDIRCPPERYSLT